MKRNRILRFSCYLLLLGFGLLLCLMPACDSNEQKPPDNEDPPETEKEDNEDNEDPPETEKEDNEEEPDDPPAKVQYKKDAILLIKSEQYYYCARVTKDTDTNAKEVPVHIYAEHLQERMGETIAVDKVHRTRDVPPGGWGARSVAAEYFKDAEWTFTWDALEMEDHYIVPLEDGEKHRVELKDIRVPIPVQR